MHKRKGVHLLRSGDYLAEVEVEFREYNESWSPTITLDDARKIERVRKALEAGRMNEVLAEAQLYRLTPVDQAAAVGAEA